MKRLDRQHDIFNLYLTVIFGVIILFFLLQTYVAQFKPATPTGAVVSTPHDIFELVGPPTSNTKIVTGSNPTPTAVKVAEYYVSDYALCGNGVIDEGEDCELSGVVGEDALYDCRNCRFVGDGRVDYLDSVTGLMEECDPGAPKFIPAIPPVNSCSGVQCSSTGNCPSGSYSTSLCAYGIYKDIMDGSSVFASYLNGLGNLHCEDEALPFDCPAQELECGITPMDFMQLDVGSDVVLTRDDVISWLVQEGVSQNLAEIRADSRELSINYPEGSAETIGPSSIAPYNKYEMKLIMFSNGTSLLDYLNEVYTADVVPTIFGNFTVYVSNSSPAWVWYVGRVMFNLLFYPDPYTAVPSLEEKQAGNAILAAYLNQFGSSVPVAAPLVAPVHLITVPVQQLVQVCGNSQCNAGEGQIIYEIILDNHVGIWNYQGNSYNIYFDVGSDKIFFTLEGITTEVAVQPTPDYSHYFGNLNMMGRTYPLVLNASSRVLKIVDPGSCPSDCPAPVCNFNFVCNANENPVNCPSDCFCGNGFVEAGEQCEPPNTITCSADCQTITPSKAVYCSNNLWDGDESDLDCGGSCSQCLLTYACWVNADCKLNNCFGTQPLPILYKGISYTSYNSIRQFAGDPELMQYSGTCQ